ncbi:MAG: NAD(P)H-dependent oxidoreductase subunit E [Spirochaetales bacterium]|nr:NAD(P)H-dependent oxidoreductase subunit E [Spirochaetales bacterium]
MAVKARPSGSVMVVGAGIAGIQSALDLANSGFKVYLVEHSPSIGGTMTQLDKTFPTNDCAMCIVSPKLVECSRHHNIEVLTYSDVKEVSGEAGNFSITVNKKARSIDPDKCTGCGTCMMTCPVTNRLQIQEIFEEDAIEEIEETERIINQYGGKRQSLITILQDVNEKFGYLPEGALRSISTHLELPLAEVYGTVCFYKAFSLEPVGKHLIKVCMGTACHVRGAGRILEELERYLGIPSGQTTEDRLFTLDTVNCLGACALGPIVSVDGDFHGNMSLLRTAKLVDEYAKRK